MRVIRKESVELILADDRIVVAFNDGHTGWVVERGWESEVRRFVERIYAVRYELPLPQFADRLQRHLSEAGVPWLGWDL